MPTKTTKKPVKAAVKKKAVNKPYVYTLVDSRTGDVFYVGKGRDRRMYQHELNARRGKPGLRHDRIRCILDAGARVECLVVGEYETDDEAYIAERWLIAKYNGLTNINCGGAGGIFGPRQETDTKRDQARAAAMLSRLVPYEQWKLQISSNLESQAVDLFGSASDCYFTLKALLEGVALGSTNNGCARL